MADVARGSTGSLRPDRVPGVSLTAGGGSLDNWFNKSAFVTPANVYGTASRFSIPGPGTVSVDGSLSKTIRFAETRTFEMRATADNVFNTVQYSGVDSTLGSATYGQVTSAGTMRQFTFTARVQVLEALELYEKDWPSPQLHRNRIAALMPLALRRATAAANPSRNPSQPSANPARQSSYTLKVNSDLVLTNVVVRDKRRERLSEASPPRISPLRKTASRKRSRASTSRASIGQRRSMRPRSTASLPTASWAT